MVLLIINVVVEVMVVVVVGGGGGGMHGDHGRGVRGWHHGFGGERGAQDTTCLNADRIFPQIPHT